MMSALLECNGLASNCDLRVNEIMFAGIHNAMSSTADSFVGPNNLKRLEDALDAGFRFIDLESCICDDQPNPLGLQLCHNTCQFEGLNIPLGNRNVEEVFTNIKGFLDANLGEVVIVSLQVKDDTLGDVHSVISGIDGFQGMLYSHPNPDDEWPTMGELVTSGERLMIMHQGNPTCTEPCYEGFIDMYKHVFDTPWDLDQEGLLDYDQSCVVLNRGSGGSKAFFLSNHFAGTGGFVSLPSSSIAQVVNERSVLDDRHKECEARLRKRPNFIMVDFWSIGDVLAYVDESNRALAPSIAPTTARPTGSAAPSEIILSSAPTSAEVVSDVPASAPTTAAPFDADVYTNSTPTATPTAGEQPFLTGVFSSEGSTFSPSRFAKSALFVACVANLVVAVPFWPN